jgi:hypothetical protein
MLMRQVIITAAALLALGINHASAQSSCPTPLSGTALTALLSNNYACQGTFPHAEWNELHQGGGTGTIQDYKMGPGSATDPSQVVGTYTISGDTTGTVTYTYTSGGVYTYNVQLIAGSSYAFCQGSAGPSYTITVQASHC